MRTFPSCAGNQSLPTGVINRDPNRVPGAENKCSPGMPLEESELHGLTLTLGVAVADQGCAFQRLLSMGQSE